MQKHGRLRVGLMQSFQFVLIMRKLAIELANVSPYLFFRRVSIFMITHFYCNRVIFTTSSGLIVRKLQDTSHTKTARGRWRGEV